VLDTDTSFETTFQKLALVLSWATLHFASVITKCETQQRPISEPCPKSFYFDKTGHFSGQRRRSFETTPKWHVFLVISLAAAMAWIKQRTAE